MRSSTRCSGSGRRDATDDGRRDRPGGRRSPRAGAAFLLIVAAGLSVILAVLFAAPLLAQSIDRDNPPPPTAAQRSDLALCANRLAAAPGDTTDPWSPERDLGVGTFLSPKPFIDNAIVCAEVFAADVMIPDYGWPMFIPLTLILIVWTGVTMAYSQRFDFSEIINLIIWVGFLALIMFTYTERTFLSPPGVPAPAFPRMVSSLAEPLVDDFVGQTFENVARTWTRLADVVVTGTRQGDFDDVPSEDSIAMFQAIAHTFNTVLVVIFVVLTAVLGAIPLLVAYFSYLWAFFSLAIITLMGPLLIPFGLIPQTNFIFWGWLRAIASATVQMLVGGVVFLICGMLVISPLTRYAASVSVLISGSDEPSILEILSRGMALVLEFLPVAIIALLGGFKVNEMASQILSGGPVPGSGIATRIGQASMIASGAGGLVRGAVSAMSSKK